MTENLPRKTDDPESRLERFRSFTIAHRRLVEAKAALMRAIWGAEPNSLILVYGPTGVGKTTLRLKIEQLIAAETLSELHEDRARIPVVSVEAVAPESGSFNWRAHFKRLLHQLDPQVGALCQRRKLSAQSTDTLWNRLSAIASPSRS
jgi:energy-coupling factor transporter ATP-binding protein EcfA2